MKIRCLIERVGVTTIVYAGKRFDFVPNEHGHSVCEVSNPGAAGYFLETLAGNFYEKYVEPGEATPEGEAPAATPQKGLGPNAKARARAKAKAKQNITEPTKE